jgi:rRNA maturation endonuclease Nob1
MNLSQVADILEKTAVFVEAVEATNAEAVTNDRQKIAQILNEQYEEATGDSLDDEALRKLANADLDVLSAFDKLAGSHQASVSDMGGPATRRDPSAALTSKEASDRADEDFLNFIMS